MKKRLLLAFALVSLTFPLLIAQRYLTEVFSSVTVTEDVAYGQGTNVLNIPITLSMDIYEPEGDTETNRPLMLLMHGGSFVAGDKKDATIVNLCENFARKGYVTASMSYRLGIDITNIQNIDVELSKAVIRSFQDHNAALRFFYKSVQDGGNPYGIDINRIISGGVSAGAISTVHSQLFTDPASAPASAQQLMVDLGGADGGNDGAPGYPSKSIGLFNIMGAILHPDMINRDDVATISFHGTTDNVVPYGNGFATFNGIPVLEVNGSSVVHQTLSSLQAVEEMNTFEGLGHDLIYDQTAMDTVIARATVFFYENVVNNSAVSTANLQLPLLKVYPNPVTNGSIQVETEYSTSFQLSDLSGQLQGSGTLFPGENKLNISNLTAGMYILNTGKHQTKIIVQK